METWIRKYIQRLDGKGISCIDPTNYRNRFMKYMRNIMISEKNYKKKTRLKDKDFATERVLIYPSSQNIDENLNQMKKEKALKYSSLSASRMIDRNQSIRRRKSKMSNNSNMNESKNLGKKSSIGILFAAKSLSEKDTKILSGGIESDLSALPGYRSAYPSTVQSQSFNNLLRDE